MRQRPPAPTVDEVGAGIYAYVQLDGGWGLSNSVFVAGSDGVLLVDSLFTERRTRALRDAIARAAGRPVRTLVNTHHHADHTYGNYLFPQAIVIGHDLCREEAAAGGLHAQSLFPGVDWGAIELRPPFVTFADRLTLYAGELELQAIHVGPAHTTDDVVVWIPERRILVAGDVVFNGGTPMCGAGSLVGLRRALTTVRALEPETIVPGHGPVCGVEVIGSQLAYLDFVEATARRAHAAGLDPLDAARQTDLGRFGGWLDSERFVANLHRAYAELGAAPEPASATLYADMVALKGSALHCVA